MSRFSWCGRLALVVLLAAMQRALVAAPLIESGVTFVPVSQVALRLPALLVDQPPAGLSHQLMGEVQVAYRMTTGAGGAAVLAVDIENRSRQAVGHYALFLGEQRPARAGEVHRLTADVELEPGGFRGGLAAGFHLMGASGDYWGEASPPAGRADVFRSGRQQVRAEWVGGSEFERRGQAPARVFPRLTVQNIAPGTRLTLRIHRLNLELGRLPEWGVWPLVTTVQLPSAGLFAAQIRLVSAKASSPDLKSTLVMVDSRGKVVFQRSRPAPARWKASAGLLLDPWQFRVPALAQDAEEETYDLFYGLQTAADDKPVKVTALASSGGTQAGDASLVRLGSVRVARKGGVWLGATFHHYPASSLGDSQRAIGSIRMKHAFARSFGNDHLMLPWWSLKGSGVHHDWDRFERWSGFFSEKGSKSLLLVITGSPPSASRHPDRRDNPFGAPGFTAIPRDLQKLGAVVEQAVQRYRDRVFAVECWNEPDVPGFFHGSQTEMADHCRVVHDAVKKVASQIPVLCPQVSTPENLGFVLGAQTSDGRPLTQYCDWLGAHVYRGLPADAQGRALSSESLADELLLLRRRVASYGLDKPLAITEFGFDRCMTHPAAGRGNLDLMSDEMKAEAVHAGVATLVEHGVRMIGLYSYDLGDDASPCSRGGYLWTTNPAVTRLNEVVVRRINDAFTDFSTVGAPW